MIPVSVFKDLIWIRELLSRECERFSCSKCEYIVEGRCVNTELIEGITRFIRAVDMVNPINGEEFK